MKVCLFSENIVCAEIIRKNWHLNAIVCQKLSSSQNIFDYAMVHNIPINYVDIESDIAHLVSNKQLDLGISFGFGIIFKQETIQQFRHGILNIHAGDLPGIRGRHPISWAFLKNLWEIGISFHGINEQIDQGALYHKFYVPRCLNDNLDDIAQKIDSSLEDNLIVAMANLKSNYFKELEEGTYLPSLINMYKDINPKDYDSKFIFNLFKSQSIYGGLSINGEKYTECHFYSSQLPHPDKKIVTCRDGVEIVLS